MATGFPDSWVSNAAKFLKKTWTFTKGETQIVADLANAFIWDSGDDAILITRVTAACRDQNGTNVSVDVLDDGVSVLSAEADIAAAGDAVIAEATIDAAEADVAANSKMSIDITCNGSDPSLDDLTIVVEYRTKLHGGD